ncbi:helix-turn-helix domain-containing protein [Sediminivirga luteola]|nr:helix-turn-helix transcriptional regulator [Sediminivirga luteola]
MSPSSPAPHARIVCHLDELLQRRGMTLTELSSQVGVSLANLSVLKNNRAKAVRYTTLVALCQALDCQPGDLFTMEAVADVPGHD